MGPNVAARSKTGQRGDHRLGGPSPPKPANEAGVTTDPEQANPANETGEVTADSAAPTPSRGPSASACLPFHELIEGGLAKGRNAVAIWQDLVDQSALSGAYESVKRYVRKLRGVRVPEPCAVILTPAAA